MPIDSTQKLQEPYKAIWVDSFTSFSVPPPSNPESVTVADTVADLQAGLLVKMCQQLELVDDRHHSKRLLIDPLETNASTFPPTLNYNDNMTKADSITLLLAPTTKYMNQITTCQEKRKSENDSLRELNNKVILMLKQLEAGQEKMQAEQMKDKEARTLLEATVAQQGTKLAQQETKLKEARMELEATVAQQGTELKKARMVLGVELKKEEEARMSLEDELDKHMEAYTKLEETQASQKAEEDRKWAQANKTIASLRHDVGFLARQLTPIHLRVLLDMGRERIAEILGYNSWDTLFQANPWSQLAETVLKEFEKRKDERCLSEEGLTYVCLPNNVRNDGNRSAHSASKAEIREALNWSDPRHKGQATSEKPLLKEVFEFVYQHDLEKVDDDSV